MYLLAKFRYHGFYRNGDINSCINSYMDTLKKVELTASICHIGRFLKSGIPIYNSKVPKMACRKTRRKTLAIAKRFAFHVKATRSWRRLWHFHSKATNCIREIQIDQGIKGSCDFIEGSASLYVTTLPGLVAISIVVAEIKCF